MARQLRIEFNGAFYHITSRGNLRDDVFFEDRDREKFLEILSKTKERYSYLLHAYALMGNHYHLLIETPKANISQIMQNINTSYTVYVNRKYQRSGHLFQGRFKGIIVDKDEYLVTLSRYIHLNPVRAGIVEKPDDYRWTSYAVHIGKKVEKALVDAGDTLSLFSDEKGGAIKAYKDFVEAGMGSEDSPFKGLDGGIVLGAKRFKEKVARMLGKLKADGELPHVKRLRDTVSIERVVSVCSTYYGTTAENLTRRSRGKAERRVAIYLSKVLSARKNGEVGDYFGINGQAVSVAIKAIEEGREKDKRLRRNLDILKERVLNGN